MSYLATNGKRYARFMVHGKRLPSIALDTSEPEELSKERAAVLAELLAVFRRAKRMDLFEKSVPQALGAAPKLFPVLLAAARKAVYLAPKVEREENTFRALAKRWTSGELRKLHPDHVAKRGDLATVEKQLEKYVFGEIGDMPLPSLELAHFDKLMSKIPEARSVGTRRHIAQHCRRVMALAVYPCKLIPASPIPEGWLPKVADSKAKSFLYPDEEATLLARESVPLTRRFLYGVLAREGARVSELAPLEWVDLDLVRGVLTLDKNKTNDPRAWALDPGVLRALVVWREMNPETRYVFEGEDGRPIYTDKLAADLRDDLRAAKVTRPELFRHDDVRRQMRAHDLRATFVTLNLAAGKSEAWITARTGHRSSTMVATYTRRAQLAQETDLGELLPLDIAIPELPIFANDETRKAARLPMLADTKPQRLQPLVRREGLEPSRLAALEPESSLLTSYAIESLENAGQGAKSNAVAKPLGSGLGNELATAFGELLDLSLALGTAGGE